MIRAENASNRAGMPKNWEEGIAREIDLVSGMGSPLSIGNTAIILYWTSDGKQWFYWMGGRKIFLSIGGI